MHRSTYKDLFVYRAWATCDRTLNYMFWLEYSFYSVTAKYFVNMKNPYSFVRKKTMMYKNFNCSPPCKGNILTKFFLVASSVVSVKSSFQRFFQVQ